MKGKTVGILGGVGPMSTVYFMEMVINMTRAAADQEHIDMIVFNHATIPDRTAYILGRSTENPLAVMALDAQKLQAAGADFVVIPCNTAHYFFEEIKAGVAIPMLNIVEGAVRYTKQAIPGLTMLGVLATDGTIQTDTYRLACEKEGIACAVPGTRDQATVMRIIYDQVKAGKKADIAAFYHVIETLKEQGCQAVILGCTELSIVKRDYNINQKDIIDSLEVLAKDTVLACGKWLKTGMEY
jgi:aspartate racemase